LVRETAVASTDHHGAYYDLAENCELTAKRGHDGRVAETETHVTAVEESSVRREQITRIERVQRVETYYADTTSKKNGKTEKAWDDF
jgi:hypothetical protein